MPNPALRHSTLCPRPQDFSSDRNYLDIPNSTLVEISIYCTAMFCDYCIQLLKFSQGVIPHAPQERPLRGDTRGFFYAQPRQWVDVPSLHVEIYEEDDVFENGQPIRWRAPVDQNGLQALHSHSTTVDCTLCAMILITYLLPLWERFATYQ